MEFIFITLDQVDVTTRSSSVREQKLYYVLFDEILAWEMHPRRILEGWDVNRACDRN